MLLRRVIVENVRSFLGRQELMVDGQISILIGPNGGGKTNLLDTIVTVLRRYIYASQYAIHAPTAEQPNRHEFRANDALNNMILERHSAGATKPQLVEVEVEVTNRDVENMRVMQKDAKDLIELTSKKYVNTHLENAQAWLVDGIQPGQRFTFSVTNGTLTKPSEKLAVDFLHYLQIFEVVGQLREEFDFAPLATPMVYLSVNRSASGFQSSVELASYNEFEQKRHNDAALSRSNNSIVALAVGRLAQKYRLLLEKDKGNAQKEFREDKNLVTLTGLLKDLGYDWSLESINPLKNQYDMRLQKQGSSFLVGAASSGERELLTYLFAIFALNVRDAVIIVDEPELHLHPKWQKSLLQLFIKLVESTGNQFLLTTHSPTFVSPQSIQYVSRVFSLNQESHIRRLNATALPDMKHLLHIVNSQNNERIFFADEVVLVEGLSDRIFFEAVLDKHGRSNASHSTLEVVSVGGKGFFSAYEKILKACHIKCHIIADLDFVENIGTEPLRSLFRLDAAELKAEVIDNPKSIDGLTLIARLDEALKTGVLADVLSLWEYIKSRRRRLRNDLQAEELATLEKFIEAKRSENIYILEKGALEDYLPVGYRSKSLEKLIELLVNPNFWDQLPADAQTELSVIARLIVAQMAPDVTVPVEPAGAAEVAVVT